MLFQIFHSCNISQQNPCGSHRLSENDCDRKFLQTRKHFKYIFKRSKYSVSIVEEFIVYLWCPAFFQNNPFQSMLQNVAKQLNKFGFIRFIY